MDRATPQNAAMVEETSAAARNLVSEVASLAAQSRKFVVNGSGPDTAERPASTRRRESRLVPEPA
jgi:methyl-accepting chemotaxis protein